MCVHKRSRYIKLYDKIFICLGKPANMSKYYKKKVHTIIVQSKEIIGYQIPGMELKSDEPIFHNPIDRITSAI